MHGPGRRNNVPACQQIEALRSSGADSGAIPEALQSTVITQLRASYQDLQRREIDLRTKVGDRHPDMIAMVAQVQETKRQINAELTRLAHSAQSDYDRAIANETLAGRKPRRLQAKDAGPGRGFDPAA